MVELLLQELQMKKPILFKTIRTAFGNNNVDTCARVVIHQPVIKANFGTSAGTQHFDSVQHCDVIMVIANPTVGHPVFAYEKENQRRQN